MKSNYIYNPYHPKLTAQDKARIKAQETPPVAATRLDQLDDYLKLCVDKRKLLLVNDLNAYHYMCCGESEKTKLPLWLTLPQYKLLKKIVKLVAYENMIFCSTATLAEAFGCVRGKVKQKLDVLDQHVRVDREGLKRGEIKVFINPMIVFKYEGSMLAAKRGLAINKWYAPTRNNLVR